MCCTHASLEQRCCHLFQCFCTYVCLCVFAINLASVLLARWVCVLEVGQKQNKAGGNRQHMEQDEEVNESYVTDSQFLCPRTFFLAYYFYHVSVCYVHFYVFDSGSHQSVIADRLILLNVTSVRNEQGKKFI